MAEEFGGNEVLGPDGRFIVIRALMWAGDGQKWTTSAQASVAWSHVKKARPEFLSLVLRNPTGRGGRPAETLDEEGMYQLLMALECPKAAEFRSRAAKVIGLYRKADPELTGELIERQTDSGVLDRLARRADAKASNRPLMDAIKEAGGQGEIFPWTNDINNKCATGKGARQLLAERDPTGTKKNSRDVQDPFELATINWLQTAERVAIKERKPQGNEPIQGIVLEVANDVFDLVMKYRPREHRGFPLPPMKAPPPKPLPPVSSMRFDRSRLWQSQPETPPVEQPRLASNPLEKPWEKHLRPAP